MSDEDRPYYCWLDTLPPERLAQFVAWYDQAPPVFRKRCEDVADGNPQLALWMAIVDRALFALGYHEAVLPHHTVRDLFELGASPHTVVSLIDDMVKVALAEIRDEDEES